MTARKRDPYVTRILARAYREASEVTQGDLARALDRDRSGVAHMLSGRHTLPADELEIFCDYLGTEALDAIEDRLGRRGVPKDREAAPITIHRGGLRLLGLVCHAGEEIAAAIEDGEIDNGERERIRRALISARDVLEDLLAKVPPNGAGSPQALVPGSDGQGRGQFSVRGAR